MSAIIDPQVAQTVNFFYFGKANVEAVIDQIERSQNPNQALAALIQDFSNISRGQVSAIGIQLNARVVELFEILNAMYESKIPGAQATQQVAARHILPQRQAPLRTEGQPLQTSNLLSSLVSTSKTALTGAHFEALKSMHRSEEPLEVSLCNYQENLAESLAAAQTVLGPINSLKLEYTEFSQDDLTALISCCPHLTRLELRDSNELSDDVIEQTKWPQELQELDIQNTSITARGLHAILQACPKLQVLHVEACQNISHLDLMRMQMPKSLVDITYTPVWKVCRNIAELCQQATEEHPSCVALTIAAVAFLESNEHANKLQAQKWLEAALNINPQFIPAAIAYAELFRSGTYDIKASPALSLAQVDMLLQPFASHPGLLACKARLLTDDDLVSEAYDLAHDAYYLAPYDDFVVATYAEVLRRNNHPVLAKTLVKRALEVNPHNTYALVCYAMLVKTKDSIEAVALLRDTLKINFHNQDALFVLGCMLIQDEQSCLEGKGFLETLIQANPEHAKAHFELAKLHLGHLQGIERDYGLALHHFQQAYSFDPKNVALLTAYGEFLRTGARNDIPMSLKLLEEAQMLLEKAPKEPQQKRTKASNPEADTSLAAILMDDVAGKAEDRKKALELCEKAFRETPHDPFLLSMLGELLLPIDPSRGIKYLSKVIKKHHECVPALLALAKHETAHEPEDAEERLTKALKLAPNDILANIARAKFEISQNRCHQAKQYVVQALKADPNSAQALLLQARILAEADAIENANLTVEHILNKTTFGQQTRLELAVLLLEFPQLLENKRADVLARLSKG